ncbi:hypothetical protein [Pedobacter paludis]|uniref:Uncharacterized protein n=1 Tax=Pedobacter paludis TaxID=2203212 RepID=A0A317EZA6_9SPHI|nr:hypothetical protein [Pedobacter paludis]PWS32184.1 hypothetical protein DF947_10465 [Pedobacter paludis]
MNNPFKRKSGATKSSGRERMANAVVGSVLKMQRAWAAWMDKSINRYSVRKRKFFLVLFCALGTSYFSSQLVMLFVSDSPLSVPAKTSLQVQVELKPNTSNSEDQIKLKAKIERFKDYLRTLDSTSQGRQKKSDLLKRRPGLLDSIAAYEKMNQ